MIPNVRLIQKRPLTSLTSQRLLTAAKSRRHCHIGWPIFFTSWLAQIWTLACLHQTTTPLGTGLSGTARHESIPSLWPMSGRMPCDKWPTICFSERLRRNKACIPSISLGSSRSCFMSTRIDLKWLQKSTVSFTNVLDSTMSSTSVSFLLECPAAEIVQKLCLVLAEPGSFSALFILCVKTHCSWGDSR